MTSLTTDQALAFKKLSPSEKLLFSINNNGVKAQSSQPTDAMLSEFMDNSLEQGQKNQFNNAALGLNLANVVGGPNAKNEKLTTKLTDEIKVFTDPSFSTPLLVDNNTQDPKTVNPARPPPTMVGDDEDTPNTPTMMGDDEDTPNTQAMEEESDDEIDWGLYLGIAAGVIALVFLFVVVWKFTRVSRAVSNVTKPPQQPTFSPPLQPPAAPQQGLTVSPPQPAVTAVPQPAAATAVTAVPQPAAATAVTAVPQPAAATAVTAASQLSVTDVLNTAKQVKDLANVAKAIAT
jgi:hypothetical protein